MSIEGRLQIRLQCRDGRVEQVAIRSSRPFGLTRVFEGKTADELLHSLPLLYSVCATAQAGAAWRACRDALQLTNSPRICAAHDMLLLCESAREHLLRVLIDWPAFLAESAKRSDLAGLVQLLPAATRALFNSDKAFGLETAVHLDQPKMLALIGLLDKLLQEAVFGIPCEQWAGLEASSAFDQWLDTGVTPSSRLPRRLRDTGDAAVGAAPVRFLPELDAEELGQRLAAPDADLFIATPDWLGECAETSALGRCRAHPLIKALAERYGYGLLTRMTARLLELALIPGQLRQRLALLGGSSDSGSERSEVRNSGIGLGETEAARGRLVHRVELDVGVIKRYQILAPTEWNFHPKGSVAQGLMTLDASDEERLKQQAAIFINAVDPCVAYTLELC